MQKYYPVLFAAMLGAAFAGAALAAEDAPPKKVVLIAGKKSHGPEGNRIHDYPWSVRLIKVMLDNSNAADRVNVEFHLNGWPRDEKTLDDADTIMVISDGRDGDKYEEAPHLQTAARIAAIEKQIKRGCGFLSFHFSTFAPDQYGQHTLRWTGGYFDWETDGKRQWYSAIRTIEGDVQLSAKDHPVLRGVKPFRMKEEFYYNIRFDPDDKALVSLLTVPALGGREPDGNIVAWARQRTKAEGGGRGFGTTCGHFYDNWKNDDFRRLILNAIVWTAGAEVPRGGVEARYYGHDEITAALEGVTGTQRAVVGGAKPQEAAEKTPEWVAPMRDVHARFNGTAGTLALFGDSITVSLAFWAPLQYVKDPPQDLADALKLIKLHQREQCWRQWRGPEHGNNGRMTIRWAHENVDAWLKKLNPEAAVIMFGTNDLSVLDRDEYDRKTRSVVKRCLDHGTVVILTTIPPKHGAAEKAAAFADAARAIARDLKVPLIDYHAEILKRRPRDWDGALPQFKDTPGGVYEVPTLISGDGVHPSNPKNAQDYSQRSLSKNGFALRNYLTAIAYAEVIRRVLKPVD